VKRFLSFLAGLLLCLDAAQGLASNADLQVVYLERPPYYFTDKGQPRGFLFSLTRKILDRAGVTATYAQQPPNRILAELRSDQQPICSIGWFKTTEREGFANFSLPIYRDMPMVLLTTVDKRDAVGRHRTLQDVFSDTSLVMAQVASFSYGQTIDRMLAEIIVRNLTVSSTQKVLPRLILEGRASYMIVAPEEVDMLLRSAGVPADRFVTLELQDVPPGNLRYLIFSKGVPADTLQRVNAAISALTDQDALLNP
jgi:polar amino acid transport system substrate-binding protein